MNAIKELCEYLSEHRSGASAKVLARLALALAKETEFPLSDLYQLPLREFDLALGLMNDWRLDRYYASRMRLFDVVLNEVLPEEAASIDLTKR